MAVNHNQGAFREVASCEEEWRTSKRRWSYGRVCLWIRLVCGHFHQRMVTLDRSGQFKEPRRLRCDNCVGARKEKS